MAQHEQNALDYFGARYLDPMLGMWISVDPKRQFASPYLYAGNGYNPIIGVDEDFTGVHSETAACVFVCVSASDNNPKDLDFQIGTTVGGGYYKTFTTSSKKKMEGQIEDVSKEDFDPLSTADLTKRREYF